MIKQKKLLSGNEFNYNYFQKLNFEGRGIEPEI